VILSPKVGKPNTMSITNKAIASPQLKNTTLKPGLGVSMELFLQSFALGFYATNRM